MRAIVIFFPFSVAQTSTDATSQIRSLPQECNDNMKITRDFINSLQNEVDRNTSEGMSGQLFNSGISLRKKINAVLNSQDDDILTLKNIRKILKPDDAVSFKLSSIDIDLNQNPNLNCLNTIYQQMVNKSGVDKSGVDTDLQPVSLARRLQSNIWDERKEATGIVERLRNNFAGVGWGKFILGTVGVFIGSAIGVAGLPLILVGTLFGCIGYFVGDMIDNFVQNESPETFNGGWDGWELFSWSNQRFWPEWGIERSFREIKPFMNNNIPLTEEQVKEAKRTLLGVDLTPIEQIDLLFLSPAPIYQGRTLVQSLFLRDVKGEDYDWYKYQAHMRQEERKERQRNKRIQR